MKIRDVVARQVVEGVAVAGSAVDAGECDGKVLLQKRFGPQLHLAERIRERRDVLADFEFDACDARLQVGGDARDVSLLVLAAFWRSMPGASGRMWQSFVCEANSTRPLFAISRHSSQVRKPSALSSMREVMSEMAAFAPYSRRMGKARV